MGWNMTARRFWARTVTVVERRFAGAVAMVRTGRRMARGLAVTLGVVTTLALFGFGANAQNTGERWGPQVQAALEKMASGDRANAMEALTSCASLFEQAVDARIAESVGGGDRARQVNNNNLYVATFGPGWSLDALKRALASNSEDMGRGTDSRGYALSPGDIAARRATICLLSLRIEQMGRGASGGQPIPPPSQGAARPSANPGQARSQPAAPPPPRAPAPPPPSYTGYDSAEAQALIAQLLRPDSAAAAAAMSTRPMVDISAVAAGGPATATSRRDDAAARQAYQAGKSRLMHNSLNDATSCLKVEPTGVRVEWGIEGRFRLINTCGFPVAASWCANVQECGQGRGNLWTLPPGKDWPIFFADPGNPSIQVGGCRAGQAKRPLPSDAEINRQGGVSEARSPPVPAPGVSLLTSHRCE